MKGEASRFRWWGHLLWATPLLHYAFVLLFYVSASISLGEWANTAGADDPKGFFGGVPLPAPEYCPFQGCYSLAWNVDRRLKSYLQICK